MGSSPRSPLGEDLRLAALFGVAGAGAGAALVPYVLAVLPHTTGAHRVASPAVLALLSAAQTGVVLFALSLAGLRLGRPLGLGAPLLAARLRREPLPPGVARSLAVAAALGFAGALVVLALDRGAFARFMPPPRVASHPALGGLALRWRGLLASFYGGIVEEGELRLFLMTGLLRLLVLARTPRGAAAATAVVVTAVLFGLGHLPAASALWPLTTPVVARAVVLNGLLGVLFGWLYYRRGIEHAMASHFAADLALHVLAAG